MKRNDYIKQFYSLGITIPALAQAYNLPEYYVERIVKHMEAFYTPIRQKVQYHVAVHEAVTTEPDPYAVDWSNAPEWADVHCFDKWLHGSWIGFDKGNDAFEWVIRSSGFTLPSNLDWKQSKRRRPQ